MTVLGTSPTLLFHGASAISESQQMKVFLYEEFYSFALLQIGLNLSNNRFWNDNACVNDSVKRS